MSNVNQFNTNSSQLTNNTLNTTNTFQKVYLSVFNFKTEKRIHTVPISLIKQIFHFMCSIYSLLVIKEGRNEQSFLQLQVIKSSALTHCLHVTILAFLLIQNEDTLKLYLMVQTKLQFKSSLGFTSKMFVP